MISVTPLPDGTRGAIWRYPTGDYSAGMIAEADLQGRLKGIDLKNLKPMGRGVPAPTHPFPEAPITEYQAKILQLAREGKITPEPRNPDDKTPKDVSNPSSVPTENVPAKISPAPISPRSVVRESQMPAVQPRTAVWPWAIGLLVLTVIALLVWKRRQ